MRGRETIPSDNAKGVVENSRRGSAIFYETGQHIPIVEYEKFNHAAFCL
jgi:hypothetical protein